MSHHALDHRLAAIADRVRAEIGPEIAPILAAAAALSSAEDKAVVADEIDAIGIAGAQLAEMVATIRPEIDEDGGVEAVCSRLRHDLRTPLVALKGYGELILEIAADEGLAGVTATVGQLLEGVAEVMVAIERALPAQSLAMTAEEDWADPQPASSGGLTGRILVADDSQANRDILVQYLSREGHEVVSVPDGLSAIEAVFEQPFDVVLLDMIMPGMNGDEVLKAIKAEARLRSLPVIMISALDSVDRIVRCIEVGAEDYLPKPFNRVLLRARIGACLEKKRLRDIERAYLDTIERELDIARHIQKSILPKGFPSHSRLNGHGLMVPAREVGGDFYDFIALDAHRIGIAIGDVSGKGIPAAFFMAITRTLLRSHALMGLSPAACLGRLNDLLCEENDQCMFVTLIYGIIDCRTGLFTYANGGHNWPALVRSDGSVRWIEGNCDTLVGVLDGSQYRDMSLQLESGDFIFLFTDGVTEAFDIDRNEFGARRLAEVLGGVGGAPVAEVTRIVLDAVKAFERGAPQSDDITCVGLRYDPAPESEFEESPPEEVLLQNQLSEVGRMATLVGEFCRRHGIPAAMEGHLDLVLDEVLTNIISYAYTDEGPHKIKVRLWRTRSRVEVEVIDDGRHHDPLACPSPDLDLSLDDRPIGGLGVHFLRTLMDGVRYCRADGHNHLLFGKALV